MIIVLVGMRWRGLRGQNGVEVRVGVDEGRDGERRNMAEDEVRSSRWVRRPCM